MPDDGDNAEDQRNCQQAPELRREARKPRQREAKTGRYVQE
jgi:hypothetical protein